MTSAASTITVAQIHCERCENTIRTALGKIRGIRTARPDAVTNTIEVTYAPGTLSEAEIRAALADIGFEPVE